MSLNEAVEAIPRKSMVLFFLIDTSGSMSGSKIGAVNAAIEEVIPVRFAKTYTVLIDIWICQK